MTGWVVPEDQNDWSLVRTRGGRTVHVKSCPRATNGRPWKWAAGRAFLEVFLTCPNVEWASCCCGFVFHETRPLLESVTNQRELTE